MEHSASHKGKWCRVDGMVFCQETDCLNCEIYLTYDRYRNPSDNNSLSGSDTSLHGVPDEKKQQS